MKTATLTAFVVIIIMSLSLVPSQLIMQPVQAQLTAKREVTMPVKVVLVGVDPGLIDTTYIKWNFNLPTTTYGQVLDPQPYSTGVVYKIDYSFTFATQAYKSKLLSYLQEIQIVKEGVNPWFYYPAAQASGYYSFSNYYPLNYTTYDANKVEDWIYNNQQDLGGFPSNGWTLMFMNLTELPSYNFHNYRAFLSDYRQTAPDGTAHYYSVQYRDSDLGYKLRYRDFMTAWGGVHRLWFDDLSAGPTFWSEIEDLPLQIVLKDNQLDLGSPYGKTWFTQYIADYVFQATWNFITPFYIYPPTYSEQYTFDVHVLDNRTEAEKRLVNIKSTIDVSRIKQAFEDLVPYSKINVQVTFDDVSNYPQLQNVIESNYKYTDSLTFGFNGQPLQYGIVDARPVYKYLQDNIGMFEPNFHRDRSEFTVPVFAFAFSKETLFTFSYKWIIAKPDSEIKALLGVALGDIALISMDQRQFRRGDYVSPVQPNKGEGFTEVVIHESGHMIGLPHPHQFGDIGDFILTAMGYYTYDYVFGQSDKDALRRAHVDQIYLGVQSTLENLPPSAADSVNAIRNQLKDVDSKYAQMDYVSAMASALKAEEMAKAVAGGAAILPGGLITSPAVASTVYVTLGIAVGLLIGFAAAWLLIKRNFLGLRLRTSARRQRRRALSRRKRK